MIRDMFINGKRVVVLLLYLFAFLSFLPAADNSVQPFSSAKKFGYTEGHPLVIVGDWDFRPFEFVNVDGQPAGYNVDVLNMILNELDIPHKFVMQEWHVANEMFKNHEADLIHALFFFFKDHPYVSTHKYINYYNLKLARHSDTPPVNKLSSLLPTDTLFAKKDDYAAMSLAEKRPLPFVMAFRSPKDGLTAISHRKQKYFIWGELPLKRKIQELSLDSIALDEIDIPAGELRIIGYNEELINIIDDQYTRLEQAGKLQKIHDHWFHPEREHDDASPIALFIIVGLLLATVAVFLLVRLVRRRVAVAVRQYSDLGQVMDQVLNMGDYSVVEWDFQSDMLYNRYGNMLPQGTMNPKEFLKHMPPEEAQHLHDLNSQLATGVISHFDMKLNLNLGTPEQPLRKTYYGNATIEMKNGKPLSIVYTTKEITDEVSEERKINIVASKYKKMFETSLIAMSFYDANGTLLDINRKMYELCNINEENKHYFFRTSLFNFPNLKGIYMPGSRELLHVCQHMEEPQLGINKYIEFRIQPVVNENDELVYYIVTNRDITAERNIYMEQRAHDRQLHDTNKAIKEYEKQLSYLLEESQMYIWNYRIAENVVNITRSPGQTEFSETIEEYLQTINANARQQAFIELQGAMQQGKPYSTILPFDRTPLDDQPTWYTIIGIPIFNKYGQLTDYFGLSRNVTELMQIQEQLRIETARAKDSGLLKAAFLANMTHEIRTPLNAIVGFSDLLPMIDNDNDKKDFIRIIRNNCDMLLRLINDILEASDIESHPMAIEPTDIDFSKAFNDICQTLEQRVQEPGLQFIKVNPYTTFPAHLDKGRMQQVITNFVTNAVKYTHQGHILVGYRATPDDGSTADSLQPKLSASLPSFTRPGLLIYCEDTGAGIPKEKQDSVFERFVKLNEYVQGTGLGLSICKSIAERCGGQIGVSSEGEGKGSTFWLWIPCEQTNQTD